MIEFRDPVAERIKTFILDETALVIDNGDYPSDPVWGELKERGSRVWLRGCDKLAAEVWSKDMDAVCSDTRQLGRALRRGEFRALISDSNSFLKGLPLPERIAEIAFILNARQAVRLSKHFAAKVSVEVPPLPGGAEQMAQYGQRLFQVCPEHILIALPFCTEGIEAASGLGRSGIPVTINNQYSLNQALKSIRSASPAYVSISIGTVAAEVSPEDRSPTTVNLARKILKFFAEHPEELNRTRLIADGLTGYKEVEQMQGFPILTLSPDTAREYHAVRAGNGSGEIIRRTPEKKAESAGTQSTAAEQSIDDRLAERSLAARRREYAELKQAIARTIDSN
jgi:transaldolase